MRSTKGFAYRRSSMASLPVDFINKILRTKNHIQHDLQIVAGSGIAVKIQTSSRFENAVQLEQADGHHGEVRHHVRSGKELAERLDHLSHVGVGLV